MVRDPETGVAFAQQPSYRRLWLESYISLLQECAAVLELGVAFGVVPDIFHPPLLLEHDHISLHRLLYSVEL